MNFFASGILVMGYAVAALLFARFWREARDRLFLLFALGFALLAIQRTALTAAAVLPLPTMAYYLLRLLAFALILAAIIDKNRR